jgi:LPS sulfotransferase NodH
LVFPVVLVKMVTSAPDRSYVVCATPRSGSTLLCATVAATGVLGRPEEFFEARHASGIPRRPREFFDDAPGLDVARVPDVDPPVHDYADVRAAGGFAAHLRAVLGRGTTPNGVFGAKLMWMHVEDLLAFAREEGDVPAADLGALLDAVLPGAALVWVRREDTVRQAVSLWRALQTQAWRDGAGFDHAEPAYDFAALHGLVERLRREDEAWADWLATREPPPLELTYEAISADPRDAAARVAGLVDVALPPLPTDGPALLRQSDERSDDWARRYLQEIR